MNFMIKILQNLAAACVISLTLFSCESGNSGAPDQASGTEVKISYPVVKDLSENITLNATTVFLKKEIVRAAFQGFIGNILKNIGDNVTPGDTLFLLRTKEAASGDSPVLSIDGNSFSGMIAVKSYSVGVVTGLDFQNGDFISEGDQVMVISNPESLIAELNVPYQYAGKIKLNSKCKIILPDRKTLDTRIAKIIPSINQSSQTQKFLLEFDQKTDLPENLNVTAVIPVKTVRLAIAVKKSAVLSDETLSQFWVMKAVNDSTAVRVDVKTGIDSDSLIQILNPELKPADRIIYSGGYGLPDTAKISITN